MYFYFFLPATVYLQRFEVHFVWFLQWIVHYYVYNVYFALYKYLFMLNRKVVASRRTKAHNFRFIKISYKYIENSPTTSFNINTTVKSHKLNWSSLIHAQSYSINRINDWTIRRPNALLFALSFYYHLSLDADQSSFFSTNNQQKIRNLLNWRDFHSFVSQVICAF